jgi:hypothetical protein
MMPSIEVCVYCSHKIEEKEKSVNLPAGVAHLACAQKTTTRANVQQIIETDVAVSYQATPVDPDQRQTDSVRVDE